MSTLLQASNPILIIYAKFINRIYRVSFHPLVLSISIDATLNLPKLQFEDKSIAMAHSYLVI